MGHPRSEADRKRAVLYLRVSTQRQADGEVSIPSQRDLCQKYCADHDLEVVGEYVDAGSGTSDKERPAYRTMLLAAEDPDRHFDVIVVHSLSRFYRNAPISELTIRNLSKKGVEVTSVTQAVGNDPNAVIGRQVIAIFDEYSSIQNSVNVIRGMNENAKQGFWNGARPPFGYRSVGVEQRGSKTKKRLVIDPVEAAMVRKIFDLYAEGDANNPPLGIANIVHWLNRNGHRTRLGARFGKGPVGEILRASYYATGAFPHGAIDRKTGERKSEDQIIFIPIPAIIDRGLFDRVQAKLTAHNPKSTPPRIINGPCLLTGLARCGCCGSGMTRTGTTRRNRRYSYYTCSGFHSTGRPECKGRHVKMERLDKLVLNAVRQKLLNPIQLTRVIEALSARRAEREYDTRQRLVTLENALAETKAKLTRLYALVENATVEVDDVLNERLTSLRGERERIAEELKRARALVHPTIALDAEMVERFSRLVTDKLENGDINAQKAYLRSIIDAVEVADQNIRIIGRRSTLSDLIAGKTSNRNVRGFDRKWRARKDSNL